MSHFIPRRASAGRLRLLEGEELFRQYHDAAGLRRGYTCTLLRRTFASWLITESMPISKLQRLLGHACTQRMDVHAHLVDDESFEVADRVMTEL